jgi:hypothetical protein
MQVVLVLLRKSNVRLQLEDGMSQTLKILQKETLQLLLVMEKRLALNPLVIMH